MFVTLTSAKLTKVNFVISSLNFGDSGDSKIEKGLFSTFGVDCARIAIAVNVIVINATATKSRVVVNFIRFINVSDFAFLKNYSLIISATFFENRGQNKLKNLTFLLDGHIFVIKIKLLTTHKRFGNG